MMIQDRVHIEVDSETELIEKYPFLKCFIKHAPFPVVKKGEMSFVDCTRALSDQNLTIYNCCSSSISEELDVLSRLIDEVSLIINPYILPTIENKTDQFNDKNMLKFLLDERRIAYTELALPQILINISAETDIKYPELLPINVRLATFSKDIRYKI